MDNAQYQLLRRKYVNSPELWGNELLIIALVDYAWLMLLDWLNDE